MCIRDRNNPGPSTTNRYGDINYFRLWSSAILVFCTVEFFRPMTSRGPLRVIMPNFIKIGQTVTEISRFMDFSNMAAVRHLGFAGRVFRPPATVLGGLYRCTKYGCNRCSSFDNMAILILHPFGLKTPIHAPKREFGGTCEPLNG